MNEGRIGYEAYAHSTGGKTFDGRDMPRWEDLPDPIQTAWEAAGLAILANVGPQMRNAVRTLEAILESAPNSSRSFGFTRSHKKAVEDARAFIEAAFGDVNTGEL